MKTFKFKKVIAAILTVVMLITTNMPMVVNAQTSEVYISSYSIDNDKNVNLTIVDTRVNYIDAQSYGMPEIKAYGNNFSFNVSEISLSAENVNGNNVVKYNVKLSNVQKKGSFNNLELELAYLNASTTLPNVILTQAVDSDSFDTMNITTTPTPDTTTASAYVANYQVVDYAGNALSSVKPGDKVIVAVTVIDERVSAETFGGVANAETNRIHPIMTQGSFTIQGSSSITAKVKDSVTVNNATGSYQALCYVLEFRDVVYQGGTNEFGFGVSYTDANSKPNNASNNSPLAYPYTGFTFNLTQATDDVPAPNIIINSANYGNVATIGQNFTLRTVATNTSQSLQLDNVSVKIELPTGLSLASGNSQVLIGTVPANGLINHDFVLVAQGVTNDITSLPVKITYTFEAYVAGKRTSYTSIQDVSINVQQPTRFAISGLDFSQEIYTGQSGYLIANLVNKGKTTIYNVTAEIISEDLTGAQVVFIGNIAPGSSIDADFDFTPMLAGLASGKVVITYEDANGIEENLTSDFEITVLEQAPWEPDGDIGVIVPEEPSANNTLIIGAVAVIFIIAAAVGFIYWKKKKALKEKELEDEDEDI